MPKTQNIRLLFYLILIVSLPVGSFATDKSSYNVKLRYINRIDFTSAPVDVQVDDEKAYVLAAGNLTRLDISDPAAPKDRRTFATISGVNSFVVSGRYIYAVSGNRITVYDVSGDSPSDRFYFDLPGNIVKLSVSNGFLVALRADFGIYVYDLKAPDVPILKGSQIIPGDGTSLFLNGTTAYVTCSSAHLSIIDFSDPVKLPVVGTYTFGTNFFDVFVQDNFAYISQGTSGTQVINVKSPFNPRWVANIFSRKSSKQTILSNYYAWVNDENTIQAFYNKDSSSYLYAGEYKNNGYGIQRIAVLDGKYILACSGDNSLKVIQIEYNY